MIKKLSLIAVAAFAAVTLKADPIQLQPAPTPAPAVPQVVRLAPVILSGSQAAVLANAIANTGMMVMPSGYSMANLSSVTLRPIATGSNAGSVQLFITLASGSANR